MPPTEISRRVITEQGHSTQVKLPELIRGVKATLYIEHEGDYRNTEPVLTTVWITQEKEI